GHGGARGERVMRMGRRELRRKCHCETAPPRTPRRGVTIVAKSRADGKQQRKVPCCIVLAAAFKWRSRMRRPAVHQGAGLNTTIAPDQLFAIPFWSARTDALNTRFTHRASP